MMSFKLKCILIKCWIFTAVSSADAGVKRSPIIHLWKGRTYEVHFYFDLHSVSLYIGLLFPLFFLTLCQHRVKITCISPL